MKKTIPFASHFTLLMFLIFSFQSLNIRAQDQVNEYQHFQLSLSFGSSIITRNSNVGLGFGFGFEPRYFINNNIAIVGRSQLYYHMIMAAEPLEYENNVTTTSYLAGVLFMNREKRNPFFYGINTGVAISQEDIGVDNDGYVIMGDPVSYWALQPRIGGCLGKFEGEISYHFATSSQARYLAFSIGYHFWGKKKKETNN